MSGQYVAVMLRRNDVEDLDLAFSRQQPSVEAVKIAQCAAHLCVSHGACARIVAVIDNELTRAQVSNHGVSCILQSLFLNMLRMRLQASASLACSLTSGVAFGCQLGVVTPSGKHLAECPLAPNIAHRLQALRVRSGQQQTKQQSERAQRSALLVASLPTPPSVRLEASQQAPPQAAAHHHFHPALLCLVSAQCLTWQLVVTVDEMAVVTRRVMKA